MSAVGMDAWVAAIEGRIREIAVDAVLEAQLLTVEVLLDGLGFERDSQRRAQIENHMAAIRRRHLDKASVCDQVKSADELHNPAPGAVADRVADPVVNDGSDLTIHDSSPSFDARPGAGHTASVGEAGPGSGELPGPSTPGGAQ